MKKIFLTLLTLLTTATLWAQAPQRMSYQSVIRDGNNVVVASTPVGIKISLLQGSATGTAVYVETHRKATNANGLLSLEIGDGTAISGTFAGIDWANGPYLIKTETDPTGGTNYSIPGIAALNSVPYALFSANGNGTPGPQGATGPLGPIGLTGIAGAAGSQGAKGDTGATGPIGPAGSDGTNGANGSPGPSGAIGDKGDTGAAGSQGPAGPMGQTGLQGSAGPIGPAGLTWRGAWSTTGNYAKDDVVGFNGASYFCLAPVSNSSSTPTSDPTKWALLASQGADGPQGPNGTAGSAGPQGLIGLTGSNGPAGPQGSQGPQGIAGANGINGLDGINNANEIAANTLKVGITTQQANEITANTAKVGISTVQTDAITANTLKVGIITQQANEITANTAKVGISTVQTDAITANTLKVGITTQQANEITANTAKDGSETKLTAGTNVTVTGNGTTASPYMVNATISSPTYTIGLNNDLGGYVIFVTPDGKHGLVAAMQDQSASINWYDAPEKISDPINHDANGKKYTDWRMPTTYELTLIHSAKAGIGGSLADDAYWFSSIEDGQTNARNLGFKAKNIGSTAKTNTLRVRSVRAF